MGGPSSESESKSELPPWYVPYAQKSLERADRAAQTGYVPYDGADIAAFAPQQVQAMQGANDWAAAFAKPGSPGAKSANVAASLPESKTYAGGIQGLSSAPGYYEAVNTLAKNRPGQYKALKSFFIDPITGASPEIEPEIEEAVKKKNLKSFNDWRQKWTTPQANGDAWPGPDIGGHN